MQPPSTWWTSCGASSRSGSDWRSVSSSWKARRSASNRSATSIPRPRPRWPAEGYGSDSTRPGPGRGSRLRKGRSWPSCRARTTTASWRCSTTRTSPWTCPRRRCQRCRFPQCGPRPRPSARPWPRTTRRWTSTAATGTKSRPWPSRRRRSSGSPWLRRAWPRLGRSSICAATSRSGTRGASSRLRQSRAGVTSSRTPGRTKTRPRCWRAPPGHGPSARFST